MPPEDQLPPKLFFLNTRTGKKFEVIARDTTRNTITLRGTFGDFTEEYSKERFKELGYKPIEEAQDTVPPAEPTDEE